MADDKAHLLTPGIASLFQPLCATEFLSDYFEQDTCVVHHGSSALAKIQEDLGGFDLQSLLEKWQPQYIAAWFDGGRGRRRSLRVTASNALDLFEKGATLYFHLNGDSAADAWLAQLCGEIGIPVRGQVSIFASPPGAGIRSHFDANNNFTVQLSGIKRWRIGPNQDIKFATQNYMPTEPIHPDLRVSIPEKIEAICPRKLKTVILSPGSVLYLPRGYWHGTTTLDGEPSISLNILCPPFTWIEVICARLRQTLLASEAWRASAHGLLRNGVDRECARPESERLLVDLENRVSSIKSTHFFRPAKNNSVPILDDQFIAVCPLANWCVSGNYGEHAYMISITDSVGLVTSLRVQRQLLNVLYVIPHAGQSIMVRSLFNGCTNSCIDSIRRLLAKLRSSGLVTIC